MKTAMQELIEQLEKTIPEIKNGNAIDKTFWLEKEKQQIISAYMAGEEGFPNNAIVSDECQKYYSETFKQ